MLLIWRKASQRYRARFSFIRRKMNPLGTTCQWPSRRFEISRPVSCRIALFQVEKVLLWNNRGRAILKKESLSRLEWRVQSRGAEAPKRAPSCATCRLEKELEETRGKQRDLESRYVLIIAIFTLETNLLGSYWAASNNLLNLVFISRKEWHNLQNSVV